MKLEYSVIVLSQSTGTPVSAVAPFACRASAERFLATQSETLLNALGIRLQVAELFPAPAHAERPWLVTKVGELVTGHTVHDEAHLR